MSNKNLKSACFASLSFCLISAIAQQLPGPQMTQPLPPGAVVSPVATGVTPSSLSLGPQLKYRDPAKPLTVGEMSELQQKKLAAEFLKQQGYTTEEPPRAAVSKAVVEKPKSFIQNLAVWGAGSQYQSELLVDGRIVRVKGGERIAKGVTVTSVGPRGVEVSIESLVKDKRKKAQQETQIKTLGAGQQFELEM